MQSIGELATNPANRIFSTAGLPDLSPSAHFDHYETVSAQWEQTEVT